MPQSYWVSELGERQRERRLPRPNSIAIRGVWTWSHLSSYLSSSWSAYATTAALAWLRLSDSGRHRAGSQLVLRGSFCGRAGARLMTRRTHAIKSRARGQLLLRRLEPEAAGAPRGRLVAVPRRPTQQRPIVTVQHDEHDLPGGGDAHPKRLLVRSSGGRNGGSNHDTRCRGRSITIVSSFTGSTSMRSYETILRR